MEFIKIRMNSIDWMLSTILYRWTRLQKISFRNVTSNGSEWQILSIIVTDIYARGKNVELHLKLLKLYNARTTPHPGQV